MVHIHWKEVASNHRARRIQSENLLYFPSIILTLQTHLSNEYNDITFMPVFTIQFIFIHNTDLMKVPQGWFICWKNNSDGDDQGFKVFIIADLKSSWFESNAKMVEI